MQYKISWKNLLNESRPKYINKEDKKETKDEDHNKTNEDLIEEHRNQFERDYDRIMSSSSLRRLQDKAQVFPLQDSDFIRTRLTHSMEVSAIARSFGTWLERTLINNKELEPYDLGKIPAMLATAGLVHDIGNPPFGHYGEDVIKKWFNKFFEEVSKEGVEYKLDLTEKQKDDFLHFDGNAQGIRVLTKLQFLNHQFGINFTYGTLSILMKYPWNSSNEKAKPKKKFGFFKADEKTASEVIDKTVGLPETRNPLTYLLEASDDIAYLGADIEDGVKKGIIPWEKIFNEKIAKEGSKIYNVYKENVIELKEKHDLAKKNAFPDYLLTSVQNFKVWAQGQMIREVKQVFVNNYQDIMNGNFSGKDLLERTENAHLISELFNGLLTDFCFPNKEVLSLELVGDSVITDLLNIFVLECILDDSDFQNDHKLRSGKLFKMISNNFVFVHCLDDEKENPFELKKICDLTDYSKLLIVTDFISGMTDSYAVDLHQKLKGVKMP